MDNIYLLLDSLVGHQSQSEKVLGPRMKMICNDEVPVDLYLNSIIDWEELM